MNSEDNVIDSSYPDLGSLQTTLDFGERTFLVVFGVVQQDRYFWFRGERSAAGVVDSPVEQTVALIGRV